MENDDRSRIARDPSAAADRAGWRRTLLARRAACVRAPDDAESIALQRRLSKTVQVLLAASDGTLAEQVIGLYWPVRGEPSLGDLPPCWHEAGARLALPVVDAAAQPLRFVSWVPGDPMQVGAYGIARPVSEHTVQPTLLIVPCLGFDARCYRLGYGGGFYDRTLAACRATSSVLPLAIGVAWDEAEVPTFDPLPTDLPMQAIVTPSRLIRS